MLESELHKIAGLEAQTVKIVDGPKPEDFRGFPLKDGHPKKYRGNHRSHNRGKGIEAFFRSLWKKTIR